MDTHVERRDNFSDAEGVQITIAPNAGACFGVVRAIKLTKQAIARSKKSQANVFAFGEVIHNPMVVGQLKAEGVRTVTDTAAVDSGSVILRSHGVRKEIEADLRKRGMEIVDATCPLVKKPQRIAQSLAQKKAFLVVVGNPDHPEVQGVLSYFNQPHFLVTYDANDVDKLPDDLKRIGVIAQTTIEYRVLDAVVEKLRSRFSDVTVYNTICDATSIRQSEAEKLAQEADIMIVVGGRNSSNTKKLVHICETFQTPTYLIEEMHEIQKDWVSGKRRIGILGGASTPEDYVDEVGQYVASLV